MKRILSILLTILLMPAICSSCRSSRQSVAEYSDTSSVVATEATQKLSYDDILSLINASRELELSGITVEFFPPDSLRPDSRAAPKSVKIESAKSKESADVTTVAASSVDEQKTVNLSAQSSEALKQDVSNDMKILTPSDWIVPLAFIGLIIVIGSIIFTKIHHL